MTLRGSNPEENMRKLTVSVVTALALSGATAQAGGMPEVVMQPEVIEQNTSSSAAGVIVPLLLLVLIAVAVGGGGGSGAPVPPT